MSSHGHALPVAKTKHSNYRSWRFWQAAIGRTTAGEPLPAADYTMPVASMLPIPSGTTTHSASRPLPFAAAVTVLLAAVTLIVSHTWATDAIWYPLPGYAAHFEPTGSTAFHLRWPVVGASVDFGPVWLAAAASGLFIFALSRRLGCSLFVAAVAALALLFSGSFWKWTSIEQPATYAVLYGLGAVGGLLLWRDTKHTLPLVGAAVCYALAVAGHPVALGALPALLWVAGYGGIVPTATLATGAAAGATCLWLATGGDSSFQAWIAPNALTSSVGRLGKLTSTFVGDFGILGAAFLLIGLVRMTGRPDRLVLLAASAAGMVACALVWRPTDWPGLLVLAFAPLWLIVAVGMEWVAACGETRAARLGIAGIIALLPMMSLAADFDNGARAGSASAFTDQYLAQLATGLPADPVLLAEGGLIDGRLSARLRQQSDIPFSRIAQTPDAVLQALRESRPVVGFAGARNNLQALGFRFEPVSSTGVSMTVAQFLDTVPDGWIVAVAVGSRFSSWILPGGGPTFGAIGGTQDLFGTSTSHYALIGVKGRTAALLEQGGPHEVELAAESGEALLPNLRAPAAIGVRSLTDGAFIEYRGREVTSSETGIALAVIRPSGHLEAVFDSELSRDGRILVSPPGLTPSLVTGREPCVLTQPGVWSDISDLAARAALGGLTESDQDLTLYVAADHSLAPYQTVVRRQVPTVDSTAFDTRSTAGRSALLSRLQEDGLDGQVAALLDQPHVHRIRVRSPGSRRQLELRLGGFATLAFARVEAGPGALTANLCGSMSPRVSRDVQLARNDLFVFGWHPLERTEKERFRWTSAPRAELLLPMDRQESAAIVIDAHPIAGAGTTLELWVNETRFAPVTLEATRREYRWDVPAESWRAGMNRVWLGVSQIVRPPDLDRSNTDGRPLGLAVRRIRLLSGR